MWHCPISGSQFNNPAKLYKRFMSTGKIELDGSEILYENNYYRWHRFYLAWIEADDMQGGEEQPIKGVVAHTERMSIKFYGRWKPHPGAIDEPEAGDLLSIDGEIWVIEEGIQRARKKSLIDFAVVFLPLHKLL